MKTDDKVDVEIDIDDELLLQLFMRAHEQNITLNQLVENLLTEFIKEHKEQENGTNSKTNPEE